MLEKKGYIEVRILGNVVAIKPNIITEYVVAESSGYFEAYQHVLKRLQMVINCPQTFSNETVGYYKYAI